MEKIFRSRTKAEEKEDSKLYHSIEDDILKIRERLKIQYWTEKDGHENSINEMVTKLDRLRDSLFSYIFDGHLASVTLEERKQDKKKAA